MANLNIEPLRCNGPRGKRLELLGYAENSIEQSLVILAGRYFGGDETLTMTGAKDAIGRATGFLEAAVSGWLTTNLEASSREWEYADYFSKQITEGRIAKIRIILITDGIMSDRIRTIESDVVAGLALGAWFAFATAVLFSRFGIIFTLSPGGWPLPRFLGLPFGIRRH